MLPQSKHATETTGRQSEALLFSFMLVDLFAVRIKMLLKSLPLCVVFGTGVWPVTPSPTTAKWTGFSSPGEPSLRVLLTVRTPKIQHPT
jgi:hypothetical protein